MKRTFCFWKSTDAACRRQEVKIKEAFFWSTSVLSHQFSSSWQEENHPLRTDLSCFLHLFLCPELYAMSAQEFRFPQVDVLSF